VNAGLSEQKSDVTYSAKPDWTEGEIKEAEDTGRHTEEWEGREWRKTKNKTKQNKLRGP
jgi:hypothetical protein